MADAIKYIHPSAQETYTVDFQDVLPSGDSALSNIGSGSLIYAVDSQGADAPGILFSKTVSSKTMTVTFKLLEDGEEYLVTFLGEGSTTKQRFIRTLGLRVRSTLSGEF